MREIIKAVAHLLMTGQPNVKSPSPDNAQRIADYWATDHKINRPRSWLEHPVILRHVHERVTGDASVNGIQWFQRAFLPVPVDAALSLGCGLGAFERDAIRMNIADRFSASDVSHGAIETAKREAANAGMMSRISYEVLDLNTDELAHAAYDVVFGLSCIHHILELDHAFEQIRRSLKPGGLLYVDEYIGPRQFQTEPHVTAIINRELATLPESYRKSLFIDGHIISSYTPSPISHFETHDPSEAIRSDEIVVKLAKRFDILEYRPYGGAILHMLLSGIAGNFSPEKPEDVALLNRFLILERELEDSGKVQSDFAVIVARPK
jgi:2-polyprenyl-3-methyl-5-hydroxy-6-metoxy-1,4-benzoquinol methylase